MFVSPLRRTGIEDTGGNPSISSEISYNLRLDFNNELFVTEVNEEFVSTNFTCKKNDFYRFYDFLTHYFCRTKQKVHSYYLQKY